MCMDSPVGSIASPTIDSQLEIPSQERLLPIGQPQPPPSVPNKEMIQLVDKVTKALGLPMQVPKVIENRMNDSNNFTRHDVTGIPSPRRLTKQVALESPPNHQENEDNVMLCRSYNIENKSTYENFVFTLLYFTLSVYVCMNTQFVSDALVNRHKIAKMGPFTIGNYSLRDPRKPGTWFSALSPHIDGGDLKQSSFRIGDDTVNER